MSDEAERRRDAVVAQVCEHLEAGVSRRAAAAQSGITDHQLAQWVRDVPEVYEAVLQAEAAFELAMVQEVVSISLGLVENESIGSQRLRLAALKWLLERRCARQWGARRSIEIEGAHATVVSGEVTLAPLFTPDALRALTPEQLAEAVRAKFGPAPEPEPQGKQ